MSEENVALVRGMLEAWASGDRERARAAFDPEVTFAIPIPDRSGGEGVSQLERSIEEWRRVFTDWRFELEETIDVGDRVIAISLQSGAGIGSGASAEFRNATVYTVSNSKIVRVEFFGTKAEALRAIGLGE